VFGHGHGVLDGVVVVVFKVQVVDTVVGVGHGVVYPALVVVFYFGKECFFLCFGV